MNNNLLISRKCVSGLGVAFLCLIMLLAGLPAMAQCPASDGAAACARENNDTPCQSADDAPLEDDVEYSRWYFCPCIIQ